MKRPKKKNIPPAAHRFDVGKTLPSHTGAVSGEIAREAYPESVRHRWSWQRKLVSAIAAAMAVLILLLLIIVVWDARNINIASQRMFGSSLLSVLNSSGLKTDANGRANVLIVGYSVDDPGHPAANLTDSLVLLSMNPANHTGYMLSIPRDLYVKIPGSGYAKINEVYKDGGADLLKQVIGNDFQTSIGYYALVDYTAVRDTVNALGGINICIKSPDPRGLYDPNINQADGGPLKLANGCQSLNGQTALNLTRARGEPAPDGRFGYGFPASDFDRTQHQRQVFTAIKQKIDWKLVLNPYKNGKIFSSISDNVRTDVKADEALPLYRLFSSIPSSQLQSVSLNDINGRNLLSSYSTPSGQSALIPAAGLEDYSEIQAAIAQLH